MCPVNCGLILPGGRLPLKEEEEEEDLGQEMIILQSKLLESGLSRDITKKNYFN